MSDFFKNTNKKCFVCQHYLLCTETGLCDKFVEDLSIRGDIDEFNEIHEESEDEF